MENIIYNNMNNDLEKYNNKIVHILEEDINSNNIKILITKVRRINCKIVFHCSLENIPSVYKNYIDGKYIFRSDIPYKK